MDPVARSDPHLRSPAACGGRRSGCAGPSISRMRRCAISASRSRGSRWRRSTRMPARAACSGTRTIDITAPVVEQSCRAEGMDGSAARFRATLCSSSHARASSTPWWRCSTTRGTSRSRCTASRRRDARQRRPGPADRAHLGRPRHGVRHRRDGDRQRGKPDRGDRLCGASGRDPPRRHCEFYTGVPADPTLNEPSLYRHGRLPGRAEGPPEDKPVPAIRSGRLPRRIVGTSRDKMLWGWAVAATCILSIVQNQPGACHDRAVCPRRNRLRSQ